MNFLISPDSGVLLMCNNQLSKKTKEPWLVASADFCGFSIPTMAGFPLMPSHWTQRWKDIWAGRSWHPLTTESGSWYYSCLQPKVLSTHLFIHPFNKLFFFYHTRNMNKVSIKLVLYCKSIALLGLLQNNIIFPIFPLRSFLRQGRWNDGFPTFK